MKPKTKKTIIWALAIVAIAIVVWLLFRKKEWEKVLDDLNLPDAIREEIRAEAKRLDSDSLKKSELEREAADVGETYARWLVMTAAMNLRYPVQGNQLGQIIINPKEKD